jgi:hypothetical protein
VILHVLFAQQELGVKPSDFKLQLALVLALLESTLRLEPSCAQTAQQVKRLLPVVRP